MKLSVGNPSILENKSNVLVFGLFEDLQKPKELEEIDNQLGKEISKRLSGKNFSEPFCIVSVSTNGKFEFNQVIVIGLGKKNDLNLEILRNASALIAKIVRDSDWKSFATLLHLVEEKKFSVFDKASVVVEGILLGLYQFNEFKTMDLKKIKSLNEVILIGGRNLKEVELAVKKATIVCANVNLAKDLINLPAISKTPRVFAKKIEKICKSEGISVKVFDKKDCEKNNFGALLAVNAGSMEEPRMVLLEYKPKTFSKTIALVGKGITFDSGGLSLKPSSGMESMKEDMTGAAYVVALIKIAKQLNFSVKIIGMIALTENMPGNKAVKPGDIIKGHSGKTIEILNTDAEGRLVLSDALSFVSGLKPDAILDFATLTGAASIAVGRYYSAVFTNDFELLSKVFTASKFSDERLWELPLSFEHKDFMRSDFADLRNMSKGPAREAGASTAAAFLSFFVEEIPWVHFDVAPTAFFLEPDKFRNYLQPGATGIGIRTVVKFLQDFK